MQLGISEILEKASNISDRAQRISYLRQNSSKSLHIVLQYALDPNIKWLVSKDLPPFNKDKVGGQETQLLAEARRLYLFIDGPMGHPDLSAHKRTILLVQLLEMLSPGDVEVIRCSIQKTLPYPNLEYDVIKEAFPDILPDVSFQTQDQPQADKGMDIFEENPSVPKDVIEALSAVKPKPSKPKRGAKKATSP